MDKLYSSKPLDIAWHHIQKYSSTPWNLKS